MTTTATPQLGFPGTTREAFAGYADALDATVETVRSYADLPAPPPGAEGCGGGQPAPTGDGVMHASPVLRGGAGAAGDSLREPCCSTQAGLRKTIGRCCRSSLNAEPPSAVRQQVPRPPITEL